MNLVEFKDALVTPLKKTIEQIKSPSIAQFKNLDDIKSQWARAEGMEMVLSHIENTFNKASESMNEKNQVVHDVSFQEIIPPSA